MVDHLEPYRQMVRSIRFVPPIWDSRSLYQHLTEPAPNEPIWQSPSTPALSSAPSREPLVTVSDAEELIRAAVSQPTVLPVIYVIQENIGDRISKLTAHQPRPAVVLPPPKIPAPDPNWVPPQVKVHPARIQDAQVKETQPEEIQPETQHSELEAVSSSERDLVSNDVIATSSKASSPSEIETEPATSAEETQPTNPISSWFQSVTTYLEEVTNKLETSSHQPADSAAIAQPTADDPNSGSTCPQCGSIEIRKNGKRSGKQKYLCGSCGRQFTSTQTDPAAVKSSKRKRAKGFGTGR